MSRDISHAVRIPDQPVIVAALILDVDTGLVRGLSVAADFEHALAEAVETALHQAGRVARPGPPATHPGGGRPGCPGAR